MKRRRLNAKTNIGDQPVSAICQAGGAGLAITQAAVVETEHVEHHAITQAVVVKTEHVEHTPKHAAVGDQPSLADKLGPMIRSLGADDCHKVLLNVAQSGAVLTLQSMQDTPCPQQQQ